MSAARRRPPPPVRADGRKVVEIVTPEGVPIPFQLARPSERAAAFVVDLLVMGLLLLGLGLVLDVLALSGGAFGAALALVGLFLVRSFYFVFFELRWQGATPGKRISGLRVTDAHGGPLRADAVVVRNLMREIELWLPLGVVLGSAYLWPDASPPVRFVATLWALVLVFMPLFNRRSMRVGDMVAGTLVAVVPRAVLASDLAGQAAPAAHRAPTRFTDAQLDVYGIYELQTLEDLLRQARTPARAQAVRAVRMRIKSKIGWKGPIHDDEQFLRDFYAALRARLEQKMLLGRRKEDKFADG